MWPKGLIAMAIVVAGFGVPMGEFTPARAQSAISVQSDEARNEFPTGVTFAITFSAPAPAKQVRFRSELAPDGTDASAIAECTGTSTTSCTHTLTSGRGITIIPGAQITYHWDIEDSAGDKLSTVPKVYVHADTRFTFRTLQQGNITLQYHAGSESAAQAVLGAAAETLDKIGALEKTSVTFPVKVFLYQTAAEMQPAIAPGQIGRGVEILGEVVYSDTAMVSADVATLDITRHEAAHIVTREATKGPFGIASWLNEGVSVYAQSKTLSGQQSALDSAISRDRVLSMSQLNSSSVGGSADTVGLFYAESGAIVRYLVDTYGADQFADLLKTFREGSTADSAFQSVYGFDQLGLENRWRASVGLQPRDAPATPESSPEARAQPTTAADGDQPSASGRSSGDGTPIVSIVVITMLAVTFVGAGAGAATVIRSRLP